MRTPGKSSLHDEIEVTCTFSTVSTGKNASIGDNFSLSYLLLLIRVD